MLYLISIKEVIKLDSGYMLKENYETAIDKVKKFIIQNGSVSVSDARDLLNSNRKSTMEFLEFLDKEKITWEEKMKEYYKVGVYMKLKILLALPSDS